MGRSLSSVLVTAKKSYENRVEQAIEEVVENARDFAPRGHSDTLRSGIASGGVVTTANQVKGFVISSAISSGGYEYAGKIHDEELNHASPEGGKAHTSFVDLARSGNTHVEKYASGYNLKGTTKYNYATDYLTKGFNAAKKNIQKIMGVD